MRSLLLAPLMALSLLACTPGTVVSSGSIPAPAAVANKSTIDETIRRTAESGYKVWRILAESGVDMGLIKGPVAAKVALLDQEIYAALLFVRKADETANSAGLVSAANNLASLLDQGAAIVRSK